MPKPKNKKQRPELILTLPCPCGMKHRLHLALGELQILQRAIIKRQQPTFNPRHVVYADTGRTDGRGQPVYEPFKPLPPPLKSSLPTPILPNPPIH